MRLHSIGDEGIMHAMRLHSIGDEGIMHAIRQRGPACYRRCVRAPVELRPRDALPCGHMDMCMHMWHVHMGQGMSAHTVWPRSARMVVVRER